MRISGVLPFIFIGVFLTSCKTELSRKEAQAILEKQLSNPPMDYWIPTRTVLLPQWKEDKERIYALQKAGLATITSQETRHGMWPATVYDIKYNEEVKSYLFGNPYRDTSIGDKTLMKAVIWEYRIDVTGIKYEGDSKAIVTYTLTPDNFSPFYDWVIKYHKIHSSYRQVQNKQAIFGLFDDGWRLEGS